MDPSVATICDVHNTLVNTMLKDYGTEAQKKKYLAPLATETVFLYHCNFSWDLSVFQKLALVLMHLL